MHNEEEKVLRDICLGNVKPEWKIFVFDGQSGYYESRANVNGHEIRRYLNESVAGQRETIQLETSYGNISATCEPGYSWEEVWEEPLC